MSLFSTLDVTREVWGGYIEPNMPIATWKQALSVVGDASGGFLAVEFVFDPAVGVEDSNLYNLEQITLSSTEAVSETYQVKTEGMGQIATGIQWAVQAFSLDGIAGNAGQSRDLRMPVWLGGQLRNFGSTQLVISTGNLLNKLLIVEAYGYVWASRSRSFPGGPRRPLGTVFG